MLEKLVEKCKSLKIEYLNRSPKGKWLFMMNICELILKSIGLNSLDPNFKMTWLFYVAGVVIVSVFSSYIYTILHFIDSPMKGFLATPMIGILIPVSTASYFHFLSFHKMKL